MIQLNTFKPYEFDFELALKQALKIRKRFAMLKRIHIQLEASEAAAEIDEAKLKRAAPSPLQLKRRSLQAESRESGPLQVASGRFRPLQADSSPLQMFQARFKSLLADASPAEPAEPAYWGP